MSGFRLTRRASLALGAASSFGPSSAYAQKLDLDDPKAAGRIRAKIMGSAAEEAVHTFMRLHFYAYRHDGNLIPLYTMNNLNVRRWSPQPDGGFKAKVFECGVYSKFDTTEPIEFWENPFSGEKIKTWPLLSGPLNLAIAADGNVTTGAEATVKPQPQNFEVIGDNVFMPQASAFSLPHPFPAQEWPKENSGERSFRDSHYVYIAKAADVANAALSNVPSVVQLQNLVSWAYWLRMGQIPGRTWGRGFGAKLTSLDALPRWVRVDMEKKTPKIFDTAHWTEFVNEVAEYKASHRP